MIKFTGRKWFFLLSSYGLGYHFLSYGNQLNDSGQIKYATQISSTSILTRDPFFLPILKDCAGEFALFHLWELRGVIGHSGHRHGWVVRPDGSWQRLTAGDRLFEDWRVTRIDSRRIDLSYDNPVKTCPIFSQAISWPIP